MMFLFAAFGGELTDANLLNRLTYVTAAFYRCLIPA